MNRHFVEMLHELSAAGVEFLIIGAHAVAAHGHVRGTLDFDVWISPTPENAERVWRALAAFGAPLDEITRDDLTKEDTIFQIGIKPNRIDLITSIAAVEFGPAWERRMMTEIEGRQYPVIGKNDLIRNKRAAARPQDLADAKALEGLSTDA